MIRSIGELKEKMISAATQRLIFRWVHIILAVPIIGYIYSPFELLPEYAPTVRYVAIPVIGLTGLWMWQGHRLRRLFFKKPMQQGAADNA